LPSSPHWAPKTTAVFARINPPASSKVTQTPAAAIKLRGQSLNADTSAPRTILNPEFRKSCEDHLARAKSATNSDDARQDL
jgi:hypothetical protein